MTDFRSRPEFSSTMLTKHDCELAINFLESFLTFNVGHLGFYTYCLTTFSKHYQIFIIVCTYDIMTCGQVS
jgi:hypothetical protein